MKKIRNVLLAGLAALAVVFGGVLTAAPAQAAWGTEVHLRNAAYDSWAKATNMNGVDKILHEGQTANNADYICPPGTNWYLHIFGPYNTSRTLAPGQCYTFTNPTSSSNPYEVDVKSTRD